MKMIPSLRERKRYLVYKVVSDKQISREMARQAVFSGIKEFLGVYGMAKAGVIYVTDNIIRVSHTEVDKAKTALSLISKISGDRAMVNTVYVSGSLNKAKSINGGA